MEMTLEERALLFAFRAHAGQERKYTSEPYITHPITVANIVKTVYHTPEMVAAALLHDTVEDTNVSFDEIRAEFGVEVERLVFWLTDVSTKADGNRETRKAIDREHYAEAPPDAQTVKVADMIHNTACVSRNDPHFWKVYRREKELLLAVLTRADTTLVEIAKEQIREDNNNE